MNIIYDENLALKENIELANKVEILKLNILNNKFLNNNIEHDLLKYLNIIRCDNNVKDVEDNVIEITNYIKDICTSVYISNINIPIVDNIQIYRNKKLVDQSYDNVDSAFYIEDPLLSVASNINGRLFIAYIASIITSWIDQRIYFHTKEKLYDIFSLFAHIDSLKLYKCVDDTYTIDDLSAIQQSIYSLLNIDPPKAEKPNLPGQKKNDPNAPEPLPSSSRPLNAMPPRKLGAKPRRKSPPDGGGKREP